MLSHGFFRCGNCLPQYCAISAPQTGFGVTATGGWCPWAQNATCGYAAIFDANPDWGRAPR